jgi:hypothetical protein
LSNPTPTMPAPVGAVSLLGVSLPAPVGAVSLLGVSLPALTLATHVDDEDVATSDVQQAKSRTMSTFRCFLIYFNPQTQERAMHWRLKAWEAMGEEMKAHVQLKWLNMGEGLKHVDWMSFKECELHTGVRPPVLGLYVRKFLAEGGLPDAEAKALKSLIFNPVTDRPNEVPYSIVEAAMTHIYEKEGSSKKPKEEYRPRKAQISLSRQMAKMREVEDRANKNEWLAMRRAIVAREAPLDLRYFPDLKEPEFYRKYQPLSEKKARLKYAKRPWLLLDIDWETGKPLKRS